MDTSLTSFLKGDVEIIGVESLIIINVTRCRYVKVNDSKQQQRWAGYEVSNLFFSHVRDEQLHFFGFQKMSKWCITIFLDAYFRRLSSHLVTL